MATARREAESRSSVSPKKSDAFEIGFMIAKNAINTVVKWVVESSIFRRAAGRRSTSSNTAARTRPRSRYGATSQLASTGLDFRRDRNNRRKNPECDDKFCEYQFQVTAPIARSNTRKDAPMLNLDTCPSDRSTNRKDAPTLFANATVREAII